MTQEVFFGTGAAKTNLSKDIRTGATRTTPEAKRRLVQIEDASPQILAAFDTFHARLDSLEQLLHNITGVAAPIVVSVVFTAVPEDQQLLTIDDVGFEFVEDVENYAGTAIPVLVAEDMSIQEMLLNLVNTWDQEKIEEHGFYMGLSSSTGEGLDTLSVTSVRLGPGPAYVIVPPAECTEDPVTESAGALPVTLPEINDKLNQLLNP